MSEGIRHLLLLLYETALALLIGLGILAVVALVYAIWRRTILSFIALTIFTALLVSEFAFAWYAAHSFDGGVTKPMLPKGLNLRTE